MYPKLFTVPKNLAMLNINYIRSITEKYFPREKAKRKRVMVVDDNVDTLSIIQLILSRNEFNVNISSTAAKVYSLKAKDLPDLFIIDINLLDADGRDVCVYLKENPDTRHIPVILYTGSSIDELKSYNNMCIPDCILSKPFTIGDLTDTIVRLLTEKKYEFIYKDDQIAN
jgi:DNA-binding response OmpR family regulator